MFNAFNNDNAHIGTKWMLRMVTSRGLQIKHLLRIVHKATKVFHYMAILSDGRHICDCCMSLNLGIPCRHYFQAWTAVKGLPFHLAFIRPRSVVISLIIGVVLITVATGTRWYKNPLIKLEDLPAVSQNHQIRSDEMKLPTRTLATALASNPVDSTVRMTPPPPTQTIGARQVFQEVQAAIRPHLASLQTQEQVEDFINKFQTIQYVVLSLLVLLVLTLATHSRQQEAEELRREKIHDPPTLSQKGRPRTARITNRLEGRARGGGASAGSMSKRAYHELQGAGDESDDAPNEEPPQKKARVYRCALCREGGHNRLNCPLNRA